MRFMNDLSSKIAEIKKIIDDAEYILIGAGSGLSTAAGIEYSGKRFEGNFAEFIRKYNFTDMYTSGFYDFETEEEKWAYWAKHIYMNNIGMEATNLYKKIFELVKEKEYFVITTNVDDQFTKAGFDKDQVFAIQGSYRYAQCTIGCHNKLYDMKDKAKEMIDKTVNCKIPSELVSVCPVCSGTMDVNLKKDAYFVQDDNWYKLNKNYEDFLNQTEDKKVVLLEFGVGFNTPGIIRFPFEQMIYQNSKWRLVRFNKDNPETYLEIGNRAIGVEDNIEDVIDELLKNKEGK